jgi:hypothetical protein
MAISRTATSFFPGTPRPGGSTDRRGCLEDTKKDSTASGARSWTAAAHEAGTHRTPYHGLLVED